MSAPEAASEPEAASAPEAAGEPEAAGAPSEPEAGVAVNETTTDNTRTIADYEIPGGSAYIEGAESTVYENTVAGNAIQQAVNAALASAQKSITIVVNDGVYSGGISIVIGTTALESAEGTSGGSGTTDNSILLKIVAHDALSTTEDEMGNQVDTITADSAGGVRLKAT